MKLQPFRDDTLKDPKATQIRLNEMVKAINAQPLASRCFRIPNFQPGNTIQLTSVGFQVGAVLLGGIWATAGGTAPTAAPYVSSWRQAPDGSINVLLGGVPSASLTPYSVVLVVLEAEGAS